MYINRIGRVGVGGVIDAQVAAGADDGGWDQSESTFNNKSNAYAIGNYGYRHIFSRWTGITIPAGATIKNSYVQIHAGNVGVVSTHLYLNDDAAPTAPTNYSTANGKVKTTANIAWVVPSAVAWAKSGDISALVQELLDSYGSFENGAIMMLLISDMADDDMNNIDMYEASYGAKIHIEW